MSLAEAWVVAGAVTAAAAYLAWVALRKWRGRGAGCGCGCGPDKPTRKRVPLTIQGRSPRQP